MAGLPPLPRNRLNLVDQFHEDFTRMFARVGQVKLDSTLCQRLARNVATALDKVPVEMAYQTLMQYEGRELTPRWGRLLARQLVARQEELRVVPLHLFDHPVRDEWVALEIYDVEKCAWSGDAPGLLIHFYCLTGHPAGHILKKKFPESWISFLAYRIGYSRRLIYQYEPEQLIGLRFWGFLLAARRGPDDLDFDEWKIDARMKKENQSILKLRLRFEIEPSRIPDGKEHEYSCPFGKEIYCSECDCSADECRAAYYRERKYVGGPVVDGAEAVRR